VVGPAKLDDVVVEALIRRDDRQMAVAALTAVAKFFGDAFENKGLRTPVPVLLAQLAKYHARCPPLAPMMRCTPQGLFCEGALLKRAAVLKDWRLRHMLLQNGHLTYFELADDSTARGRFKVQATSAVRLPTDAERGYPAGYENWGSGFHIHDGHFVLVLTAEQVQRPVPVDVHLAARNSAERDEWIGVLRAMIDEASEDPADEANASLSARPAGALPQTGVGNRCQRLSVGADLPPPLSAASLRDSCRAIRHAHAVYGADTLIGEGYVLPAAVAADSVCDASARYAIRFLTQLSDKDIILTLPPKRGPRRCPRYYLAVDHGARAIVLSIRGTKRIADALCDFLCNDAPFEGMVAHQGIAEAAAQVFRETTPTVAHHARLHPEYALWITGHSLGGGTATLTAVLYTKEVHAQRAREADPDSTSLSSELPGDLAVRCFAFAPPPVLRRSDEGAPSAPAEEALANTLAFVHNNDIITRWSGHNLADIARQLRAVDGMSADSLKDLAGRVYSLAARSSAQKAAAERVHAAVRLEPTGRRPPQLVIGGNVFLFWPTSGPERIPAADSAGADRRCGGDGIKSSAVALPEQLRSFSAQDFGLVRVGATCSALSTIRISGSAVEDHYSQYYDCGLHRCLQQHESHGSLGITWT
jgi:hypothetical protein